jgi:hypothetical protein
MLDQEKSGNPGAYTDLHSMVSRNLYYLGTTFTWHREAVSPDLFAAVPIFYISNFIQMLQYYKMYVVCSCKYRAFSKFLCKYVF